MRTRPTVVLRPAPAALPRPVPTTPLEHPIGEASLHEASSGVHWCSPITPEPLAAAQEPGGAASRRSSPRLPPPDGTKAASASTPGFAPRGHPQRTPRRRRAIAHWPGHSTSASAGLHGASHFTHAPSRRTQPYVASSTTSGSGPALASSIASATGRCRCGPAQLLALLGHPHDHTAAAVQIDTDVLATVVVSAHGASLNVTNEHPRASARDHEGRRPRPFIASSGVRLASRGAAGGRV